MKPAYYCQPCGGTDANATTVLAVKGRCEHCGTPDVPLYRCPARPLPGLELR